MGHRGRAADRRHPYIDLAAVDDGLAPFLGEVGQGILNPATAVAGLRQLEPLQDCLDAQADGALGHCERYRDGGVVLPLDDLFKKAGFNLGDFTVQSLAARLPSISTRSQCAAGPT